MRTASGQVFAVPGDFMAVSADANPIGSLVGQTIRDERKHTENGREITDATTAGIQIEAVREPLKIRLLQFSAAHELLESEEFEPGAVPEQIVPLAAADYLLLETIEKGPDGEPAGTMAFAFSITTTFSGMGSFPKRMLPKNLRKQRKRFEAAGKSSYLKQGDSAGALFSAEIFSAFIPRRRGTGP